MKAITFDELENRIVQFIKSMDKPSSQFHTHGNPADQFKVIMYYFNNPLQVRGAANAGGLYNLRQVYDYYLTKYQLKDKGLAIDYDARKFSQAATLIAQTIKVRNAYNDILKGQKFIRANIGMRGFKNTNPIEKISRNNLEHLITGLKKSNSNNPYGLRDDEIDLFAALLNLPYKMQHATNMYYPIISSGSLDSYTEIKRHDPKYESEFSTKGNIEKLGNGGFVFFRIYVDGVNGTETRYGKTSLVFDMNLLRKCGWISLHDQLVPFSTKNSRKFFWGNILLRKSEPVGIKNKTKDMGLSDGLQYEYRTAAITNSYTEGKIESTLKKSPAKRIIPYTNEIFYGKNILLGIVLSVIKELRYLEKCGFREDFLSFFEGVKNDAPQKIELLGKLIKGLFRIEGKYPVALKLTLPDVNQDSKPAFEPIARMGAFLDKDKYATVINPDGDNRYNIDLSVNPEEFERAAFENELKIMDSYISQSKKQLGRKNISQTVKEKWKNKLMESENRKKQIDDLLAEKKRQREANEIIFLINEAREDFPLALQMLDENDAQISVKNQGRALQNAGILPAVIAEMEKSRKISGKKDIQAMKKDWKNKLTEVECLGKQKDHLSSQKESGKKKNLILDILDETVEEFSPAQQISAKNAAKTSEKNHGQALQAPERSLRTARADMEEDRKKSGIKNIQAMKEDWKNKLNEIERRNNQSGHLLSQKECEEDSITDLADEIAEDFSLELQITDENKPKISRKNQEEILHTEKRLLTTVTNIEESGNKISNSKSGKSCSLATSMGIFSSKSTSKIVSHPIVKKEIFNHIHRKSSK